MSCLQITLQSYDNQNSMVLAQKHTSMEQNREPKYKPAHIQPIYDQGSNNIK